MVNRPADLLVNALAHDEALPVQIFQYVPFLIYLQADDAARKLLWSRLKTTNTLNQWLTADTKAAVEQHFSECGLDLV